MQWRTRTHRQKWEDGCYFARKGDLNLEVSVQSDRCVVTVHGHQVPGDSVAITLHRETVMQGTGGMAPTHAIIEKSFRRAELAADKLLKARR